MWMVTMTDDDVKKLTTRIDTLEGELQLQKDLVAELLKRIYGAKSEKIDTAQLLLDLLGDGPKKPDAAECQDAPAAEPEENKAGKKKPRRQKLRDSLKALPTFTTEIIPPELSTFCSPSVPSTKSSVSRPSSISDVPCACWLSELWHPRSASGSKRSPTSLRIVIARFYPTKVPPPPRFLAAIETE